MSELGGMGLVPILPLTKWRGKVSLSLIYSLFIKSRPGAPGVAMVKMQVKTNSLWKVKRRSI